LRYVLAVVGLVVLVGGLIAIKGAQIGSLMAFGKKAQEAGPPPESVAATPAVEQSWESTLEAIGSVASSKGVAVSAEAPGEVKKIHFESGATVKQGQVLVELDTRVERAQLASAISRRDLASVNVTRTRALAEAGIMAKAQLDADAAAVRTASADVEALSAQIARKVIRAPFAGKLGMRTVNVGQYLNPGTPVATLESVDDVYVDFSLPQQELDKLKTGMLVRISLRDVPGPPLDGKLVAIDPSVVATTRSVKLRASVPDDADKLRPGMFVGASVVLPEAKSYVIVPLTAVVHASYGDSVFVVENGDNGKTARQQFVRTGPKRGDFVAVLEGVKAGETVVEAGAFKLRNGARVALTDRAVPKPDLHPQPINR
jgi:membrane fusion protein (multidrug efflux system)